MKTASELKKAVVMGAGTMGPGIAQILAMAGCDVRLYDISREALDKAKSVLHASLETFAGEGLIGKDKIEPLFSRVSYSDALEDSVRDADLVVEAIVENKDVKAKVYKQLDAILRADAIIASNTSFLNIFDIMPPSRLAHTVIAHWYQPPQLIPLVEVVPHEKTLPEVLEAVMDLLKAGGKNPVAMKKFIQGYIVNRLQMCLNQEIFFLLDNGYCSPEDIDIAVKTSFIPRAMVLGIVKRIDFGGLNMTANNFKNKSYTMPEPVDMPRTLAEHIEKGELGIRSGKGFYDYSGMDMNEVLAKRDRQLFEAFRLSKKLMDDPV